MLSFRYQVFDEVEKFSQVQNKHKFLFSWINNSRLYSPFGMTVFKIFLKKTYWENVIIYYTSWP